MAGSPEPKIFSRQSPHMYLVNLTAQLNLAIQVHRAILYKTPENHRKMSQRASVQSPTCKGIITQLKGDVKHILWSYSKKTQYVVGPSQLASDISHLFCTMSPIHSNKAR